MINETHIETKFAIGELVQHKFLAFRGVIFDIDPSFNNTEEWYLAIPKNFRPRKDQPFYHLLADNGNMFYNAYVSEQNLVVEQSPKQVNHPDISFYFAEFDGKKYQLNKQRVN